MQTTTRLALGLLLVAASAQACTVSPGDGTVCSADPCSWCSGKAAGVYADPGALGKSYFDCFTPTGAECLACRGGESDAQCPSTPASPSTTSPASPAPTTAAPASPTPGCTVQPGDGTMCSANPCTFCAGKADGVYPDPNVNFTGHSFYDCFSSNSPGGAECLACSGGEVDAQCPKPTTPPAPPASPTTGAPASPASTGTCTVQPGDGSTCSQDPCAFCAGRTGTFADPGNQGTYWFDCWAGAANYAGAECLKCYSDTWSACTAPGAPALPAAPVTTVPSTPASPAVTASQVQSTISEAISAALAG